VTFLTVPANILVFSRWEKTSTGLKEPSASRQQDVMGEAEEYVYRLVIIGLWAETAKG